MYSKYQENSPAKKIPPVIAVFLALFLQGIATSANADEITASFERMLNPVDKVGQPTIAHQAERDPLYIFVNTALWSAPTSDTNIAASFGHMLNPVETAGQPTVTYQAEHDPLYIMVNTKLWSTPAFHDNVWIALFAYVQP